MKYNLCSSCQFFQPRLLTEEKSIPKSCKCSFLHDVFGSDVGGFPSGIDIVHCDYHKQYDWHYGDVCINGFRGKVSYVLTQPRNFKMLRVPQLYDNLQNIKILKLDNYVKKSSS